MRMNKHLQKIGFVLILMLITFWIAMVPIARVDGFNVFPWLDIPFHLWGGFLLGLIATRVIYLLENNRYNGRKFIKRGNSDYAFKFLRFIMVFVFIFGLFWEVWEYWMYVSGHVPKWGGVMDTIKDLFDDLVGGVIAYQYNIKTINKNSESKKEKDF